MFMIEWLSQPWPWYVAGPLIGLMVPLLLLVGNRSFGMSSNLRHICAACMPANVPFFRYNWWNERWNLVLVLGVIVGALVASTVLANPNPLPIDSALAEELSGYGIGSPEALFPVELMGAQALGKPLAWVLLVGGGFLVGFGTRYAGGCTSGHSITGLSTLQVPSLIATVCFMLGGILTANFLLPLLLR